MIELRCGDLHLTLDPDTGGAIAGFAWRGAALLRPVADRRLAAQRGRAVAAYPLLPFANRITNGRFSFGGERFQLGRNFEGEPHAIHGNGWMRRWTVAAADAGQALLLLDHCPPEDPAGEWPFAYRATQHFALHPAMLCLTLTLENRDARPFPAGIGLHPYVARSSATTLRFEADTVWTAGADGLPAERIALQGDDEFAGGRLLGGRQIDACYAGWGGVASVAMPDAGVTLVIDTGPPLDHLQLYTPAGEDYFGLEPVSNMPDAVNRMEMDADQGMQVLQPGETLQARIEIGVRSERLSTVP